MEIRPSAAITGVHRLPIDKVMPIYMVALMVIWTLFDILILPDLHHSAGGIVLAIALELMIWTLPALYLMRVYADELYIPLREAFTFTSKTMRWSMLLCSLVIIFNLTVRAVQVDFLEIDLALEGVTFFESVLLIGFTEELVFRGWILNAYAKRIGPWRASFIAEALLIVMHLPAWVADGMFGTTLILAEIAKVFCLGIFYGLSFKKSHSLWTAMLVHMLFNFMQAVLFGGLH